MRVAVFKFNDGVARWPRLVAGACLLVGLWGLVTYGVGNQTQAYSPAPKINVSIDQPPVTGLKTANQVRVNISIPKDFVDMEVDKFYYAWLRESHDFGALPPTRDSYIMSPYAPYCPEFSLDATSNYRSLTLKELRHREGASYRQYSNGHAYLQAIITLGDKSWGSTSEDRILCAWVTSRKTDDHTQTGTAPFTNGLFASQSRFDLEGPILKVTQLEDDNNHYRFQIEVKGATYAGVHYTTSSLATSSKCGDKTDVASTFPEGWVDKRITQDQWSSPNNKIASVPKRVVAESARGNQPKRAVLCVIAQDNLGNKSFHLETRALDSSPQPITGSPSRPVPETPATPRQEVPVTKDEETADQPEPTAPEAPAQPIDQETPEEDSPSTTSQEPNQADASDGQDDNTTTSDSSDWVWLVAALVVSFGAAIFFVKTRGK